MSENRQIPNFTSLKYLLGLAQIPNNLPGQRARKRKAQESKLADHAKTIIQLRDGELFTFRKIRDHLASKGIAASVSTIHGFYNKCKGI